MTPLEVIGTYRRELKTSPLKRIGEQVNASAFDADTDRGGTYMLFHDPWITITPRMCLNLLLLCFDLMNRLLFLRDLTSLFIISAQYVVDNLIITINPLYIPTYIKYNPI